MTVPNEPGEFRLWAQGGATGTLRVTTLGPSQALVTVGDTMVPAEIEVAMGGTLEIDHQTGQARHFKLERPDWKQQRLDGHQLTLHPLFRRLFHMNCRTLSGCSLPYRRARYGVVVLLRSASCVLRSVTAVHFGSKTVNKRCEKPLMKPPVPCCAATVMD